MEPPNSTTRVTSLIVNLGDPIILFGLLLGVSCFGAIGPALTCEGCWRVSLGQFFRDSSLGMGVALVSYNLEFVQQNPIPLIGVAFLVSSMGEKTRNRLLQWYLERKKQ